jgi:hypothetical protein
MATSKDLRKGTMVTLRNGWAARIEDNNTRGHTRLATVYGTYTEMGSIYTTDIVEAELNGSSVIVQHSPALLKAAKSRAAWGF